VAVLSKNFGTRFLLDSVVNRIYFFIASFIRDFLSRGYELPKWKYKT